MTEVSLREYLELRFDALDERLEQLGDHETRIRALERDRPRRNIIEAIIAIVAALAAVLGLKQ